jgi:hypothetical protein
MVITSMFQSSNLPWVSMGKSFFCILVVLFDSYCARSGQFLFVMLDCSHCGAMWRNESHPSHSRCPPPQI